MCIRSSIVEGIRATAPILVGVVPFGMIYGVVAVSEGLDRLPAILMSSLVFAGASQIAAAELWGQGAPFAIVVATGLVINLRFLMYSASLAPHMTGLSTWQRWVGSYLLTDQAYAVSVIRFQDHTTSTASASTSDRRSCCGRRGRPRRLSA
jgi:predicted branched-subunit amino acid permease